MEHRNLYRIELSKHKHKRDVIDTLNSDYVYSTNAEVINAVINYKKYPKTLEKNVLWVPLKPSILTKISTAFLYFTLTKN